MWCLSTVRACRSLHPHRVCQLASTARRAAQCSFFSTAKKPKMDEGGTNYGRWTKDALIKRIKTLENEIRAKGQSGTPVVASTEAAVTNSSTSTGESEGEAKTEAEPQRKKKKKDRRDIDPSKYSTRLVALKLAYLGKNYGGFEFQVHGRVPTIEEELWKAMVKACLIFPENPDEVNWDGLEYSKCGRTDRGVSAFGQVISLRVRSNRPLPKEPEGHSTVQSDDEPVTETTTTAQDIGETEALEATPKREFDDVVDELPYPRLLNKLLPPDIRILAWCPTLPADFSARHHCRERQYRYFFTQPAYSPLPNSLENPQQNQSQGAAKKKPKDGWLDIEAMRVAAKKYEGLHDFRNFCRIDGSKQNQNFVRRIFESDIVEVHDVETALPHLLSDEFQPAPPPPSSTTDTTTTTTTTPTPTTQENFPKVYYFHVRGSAFLWHQIRCMVSVLFAVGQGLEDASVIDALLDVTSEPRRPAYTLANETPLVLWNCLFPRDLDDPTRTDGMDWVYLGEDAPLNAHGGSGLVDDVWEHWRERKMDELLAAQLLGIVATQADLARRLNPKAPRYAPVVGKAFEGGNRERSVGRYVPLLKKARLASPQEAYDKEARRKGFEDAAHMQAVIAQRRAEVEAAGGDVPQNTADDNDE
ncbi:pseudouridine synthase [Xylaria sp. FL1042]|nr:pseudouridine synthase [Xylaria sp. FL1042]